MTAIGVFMDLKAQLAKARLYFVMGSSPGRPALETAESALKGGVDILQLREYSLNDQEFLKLAMALRQLTLKHNALFIVNNRPDLARLSDADGVHLGQDDLPVAEARRILDDGKLVGVSTHSTDQACRALANGADYIGVGPVFATPTKPGRPAAGLEYVRQAAQLHLAIPFFAIGGIEPSNIGDVLKAGAERIAVVRAIGEASDPRKAAAELKKALENRPPAIARP